MKTFADAENVTPQQLKGMTEPQVDELFAAAWDERYDRVMSLHGLWDDLHHDVGDRRISRQGWRMSLGEVEETAHRQAKEKPEGEAAKTLARMNAAKARIADLDSGVLAKLEAEENRRGGWPRVYLVTDGHAHSSRYCSTCNNGQFPTRFSWLIDFSGKSQAEIIDAIKDRACSVCYPDAPVNRGEKVGKSTLLTPEEEERAKLREEEAARRAEKAAKAALNAITQPDGSDLRQEVDREGRQYGSVLKTLRSARTRLKSILWYQYAWGDEDGAYERTIQHIARAVAWKENGFVIGAEPVEDEIQAVIEPLRNKAIKEVDKARREQKN